MASSQREGSDLARQLQRETLPRAVKSKVSMKDMSTLDLHVHIDTLMGTCTHVNIYTHTFEVGCNMVEETNNM